MLQAWSGLPDGGQQALRRLCHELTEWADGYWLFSQHRRYFGCGGVTSQPRGSLPMAPHRPARH